MTIWEKLLVIFMLACMFTLMAREVINPHIEMGDIKYEQR